MQKSRRHYDADFKKNAVALVNSEGRTVADVAESLGIKPDLLYRWQKERQALGNIAFPGNGKQALTEQQH